MESDDEAGWDLSWARLHLVAANHFAREAEHVALGKRLPIRPHVEPRNASASIPPATARQPRTPSPVGRGVTRAPVRTRVVIWPTGCSTTSCSPAAGGADHDIAQRDQRRPVERGLDQRRARRVAHEPVGQPHRARLERPRLRHAVMGLV